MPAQRFVSLAALVLTLGMVAAACDADEDNPAGDRATVRVALLSDLAGRVIEPAHATFRADAEAMAAAVAAFEADATPAALDAAQAAWTTAARSWRRLSALNLPGVRFSLAHNRINTWPANTAFVEDAVATDAVIDDAYVAARGSNARGLPGLEYLLFAGGDAAVLEAMAHPQRRAYARAVAADVAAQGRALEAAWAPDGGDEIGMFLAADTEGRDLQSSLSRVVNEMAMVAEDLRYTKVGRPLGIGRGPSDPTGDPQPDLVEAPYARASLALYRENLAGLRALVTAGGGTGLDDYLVTLDAQLDGQPLGAALLAQIDAVDAAAAAIDGPLRRAVDTQPDAVRALYDEAGGLLRLVKTDLANWLGVSITFSDNDGD